MEVDESLPRINSANQMPWKKTDLERSYDCNRLLLKYFRERKGWSQEQLGTKAGVSVRVVSKAERGDSVATKTIDKFAKALSIDGHDVFPEDLISDPLDLTKQFVVAMHVKRHHMMDDVGALIEPDALFRISGNPKQIPFAGKHRGPRAFRRAMTKFYEIFEFAPEFDHATAYQYFPKGTDVVLWGESLVRPVDSDVPPETVEHRIRFRYRRGLLYSFEDRYDTRNSEKLIATASKVLGSKIYDPLEDSGIVET